MKSKGNIKILRWFNFFTDLKFYHALAIIYFAKVTGSYALGMSIFSICMLSTAVFEIPTGVFSDFIGRKNTVILGSLSAVAYSVLYAVGGSYRMLVIGAIIEGLSFSFYSGNNDALIHDTLSENAGESDFSRYSGEVSSMSQFALAFSALVGAPLAFFSMPLALWLSVISQLICFFLSLFLVEPKVIIKESTNIYSHLKDSIKEFLNNKKLRITSLASMVGYGLGETTYNFQSAFYNMVWPIWAIGIAKMLSNLSGGLSFISSGRLIKKFGEVKILIFEQLYNRTVNFISLLFPSILSPIIMSTTSILYGVSSVAERTLLQKEFTSRQRATMGSLNSLGGSLLFALFAYFIGLVSDKINPIRAMIMMQFLQMMVLYLYFKLSKETNNAGKN